MATIRDAFQILAGTYGMVVTVVNQDGVLVGVVTDGDLKKSLLSGHSLDTNLSDVMNSNPVIIQVDGDITNLDTTKIRNQLKERGVSLGSYGDLFAIPVVDKIGAPIGLTTLEILGSFGQLQYGRIDSKDFGPPRVLVVGGGGYIGSVLVDKLLLNGSQVKVLDNLYYSQNSLEKYTGNPNFSCIRGDVCNLSTQVDAIHDIDCVVFLAEIVGDPSCDLVPEIALRTNYLAVNSMAALCSHMHVNRFIYTSSCSVYGASADPEVLLTEQSTLNPVSHYARMKIASEEALFSQSNPLFCPTVLRLGTVFGLSYRPRFDLVVNTFARDAYSKGLLTVHGGDQWRPNVYVGDVAETIIRMIHQPVDNISREVFNVGSSSGNSTILSIAQMVAEIFSGCRVDVREESVDKRNYRVDFTKLENFLGDGPSTSIVDGLQELKKAFDSERLTDLYDESYSNIDALRERFETAA